MTYEISPLDQHNQTLLDNVHPADWQNPTPEGKYNLVVIGAGAAGLVSAAGAAGLGAKVALIEENLMGGDCLNIGCVPSKSLIASAHLQGMLNRAESLGFDNAQAQANFGKIMERLRAVRAGIAPHDSVQRFADLGIDVFLGRGEFVDDKTVQVKGKAGDATLTFKKAFICTGARAALPSVPGLAEANPYTNESIFNLTERPERLAIIGAGPIGCELAQAFARLGSQVTLFEYNDQILGREDRDAADIVEQAMRDDGVEIITSARLQNVDARSISFSRGDGMIGESIDFSHIMVGAGRKPNVEGLGLENVGVEYNERGLLVDDRLRTANKRIYGVGDVAMKWQFTHAADAAARLALRNAFFFGRGKISSTVMPWGTYTDPEVAHVGLYEYEAKEQGIAIDTYTEYFKDNDRAKADGEAEGPTAGFLKVHTKQGSDKILGATIVGSRAADMLNEITAAMTLGIGLGKLANVIHPYPNQGEIVKRVADAYNRTRLSPKVARLFAAWFRFLRR